jgi:N-acetylglutamate synthase-like GNAT family acetyltransferase
VALRAQRLVATPLAALERDSLAATLAKAGLPAVDVREPGQLFWRFQRDDMPVGFGGLEIHGDAALLHSIVTLPSQRRRGIGGAIVAALEAEVPRHSCRNIFLLTTEPDFFAHLGYAKTARNKVPKAIQKTAHFTALVASATIMVKRLK